MIERVAFASLKVSCLLLCLPIGLPHLLLVVMPQRLTHAEAAGPAKSCSPTSCCTGALAPTYCFILGQSVNGRAVMSGCKKHLQWYVHAFSTRTKRYSRAQVAAKFSPGRDLEQQQLPQRLNA
jgi:hypothetical protein